MSDKLTDEDFALLGMFRPDTYAACLGGEGRRLETAGLVKRVPPVWGNAASFAITAEGRQALAQYQARKGEG